MLSSTEMGGEQIIIHNNAHPVIWKEPGGCVCDKTYIKTAVVATSLTCRLFVYTTGGVYVYLYSCIH